MQKFLDWLERVLTPLAKVIGENKYLVAIRDCRNGILGCLICLVKTGRQ